MGLGSTGNTERLQYPSKDPQSSPRAQVFQEPTSLENAQEQSGVSAKPEAEMGQREAGRPSNCNTSANPTVNRLQKVIRAVVRKPVATWRHPQAGRPREVGRPHFAASQAPASRGRQAHRPYLLTTDATGNNCQYRPQEAIKGSTIPHSRHHLELFSSTCTF